MVLEYGDISALKNKQWFLCELRSEKTIESTMKRVGKALHGIFRHEPVEIFIPVVKRDLDVFELSTGPYIFVRSTSFPALLRLKQITGVVSLVTEGESNRPSKAIAVEDDYVQTLIKQAEEEHRKRAIGIEVGSFVRILNGETRDYCGVVEIIGDGRAVVRITLRTKSILLETPIRNLLNISYVPMNQRVYYYGPLIDNLVKDSGEAGLQLIEEDLHMDETNQPTESIVEQPVEPKRHSRQRTVTALVKKLVLIEGQHNPMEIAKLVVASLKKKEIKAPKNLFIAYCLPGETIMQGLVPFRAGCGLSASVLDSNGDIQAITDYMTRPYKGKLIEIGLNGNLPFRSTPEHELLVLRSRKNHKSQTWRPHWGYTPKFLKNSAPVWIPASEVKDSDFLLCPAKLPQVSRTPNFYTSTHYLAKEINTNIQPDPDLAWLFGLYVADGGKTTYNSFSITLNKRTDRSRIISALDKLGVIPRIDEYDTYGIVYVNSVSLATTFRNWFGEDCYTKHFPEFIYGWNEECLRHLIEGYVEGDGHAVHASYERQDGRWVTASAKRGAPKNGSYSAVTVSYQLAYQLWYLLVAMKCYPRISDYKDGEVTNFGHRSKSWAVFWHDPKKRTRHDTFYHGDYYCMPVESTTAVEFDGNVHNFSVAKTETYVANGVVAHNCIIKDQLMKNHFRKIDSSIRNYREVIKRFGREYKFSANQIAKLDSELNIPVLTQEVCKDGRSREARQKSKKTTVVRKTAKKSHKSIKKRKLPGNKCSECSHERKAHKISPRGTWARCQWVKGKDSNPCFCKRFKEHPRK